MTSLDQNKTGPPVKKNAFVHKLYGMLNNAKLADLIWWSGSPEGHTFSLKPSKDFAQALNGYFKHGNIASFVRQLHMYGFHKVSDPHPSSQLANDRASPVWEFRHSSGRFKKNDESSLAYIKRRSQSVSSRNQVIDSSTGHMNSQFSMHQAGAPIPSHNHMPYPKYHQTGGVAHPYSYNAFVPYSKPSDVNGLPYPSKAVSTPPYGDSQGHYFHNQPHHMVPNSTSEASLQHSSMVQHPGGNVGGGFMRNANSAIPQHYIDNRNHSPHPVPPFPQPGHQEAPVTGQHHEGSSQFNPQRAPFHPSAYPPIVAHVRPGGPESNMDSNTSTHVYERHAEVARASTPDMSIRSATMPPLSGPEGDSAANTSSLYNEQSALPFAPKPLRSSSLSTYNITASDSTSGAGDPATPPTDFTFRRPFATQNMERQRNPSLLYDPLTVVDKNIPKPVVSSQKTGNHDIKLPPLSALSSPIIPKEGAPKDEFPKSLDNSADDRPNVTRQGSILGNDWNNPQPRPFATHSSSLRDKIRPSLVNLHSTSQGSIIFPGIQHAKTVDSIGSHSSSLFSNGSSISSTSTSSSFDSASYRRKSSLTMGPHDQNPPSPGLRTPSPGLTLPGSSHAERVGTISEEPSDSSTIDSHQGIAPQNPDVKGTPSQEPKLEFLLDSAEESLKKQKA